MSSTSPVTIESLPHRVSIPVDLAGTPLDDYTGLLVRLKECERALADEQAHHQAAVDRTWATLVERLAVPLREAANDSSPPSERLAALVQAIERMWSEAGIEIVDPTGQRLQEARSLNLEVLCTRATSDPAEEGRIAETWRPLVRRQGHTIQSGQVVVLTQNAPATAENGR